MLILKLYDELYIPIKEKPSLYLINEKIRSIKAGTNVFVFWDVIHEVNKGKNSIQSHKLNQKIQHFLYTYI